MPEAGAVLLLFLFLSRANAPSRLDNGVHECCMKTKCNKQYEYSNTFTLMFSNRCFCGKTRIQRKYQKKYNFVILTRLNQKEKTHRLFYIFKSGFKKKDSEMKRGRCSHVIVEKKIVATKNVSISTPWEMGVRTPFWNVSRHTQSFNCAFITVELRPLGTVFQESPACGRSSCHVIAREAALFSRAVV